MSKPLSQSDGEIRVEPIFDYKHGRRFQIIAVNKEPNATFTVHKDMMGRDYIKLKLSDADLLRLIDEVRKTMGSMEADPKIAEIRFKKNRFQVIPGEKEDGRDPQDA